MTQNEITRVGNELIAAATQKAGAGESLQAFYDDLENESRALGGDESMPLGWVAEEILQISLEHGSPVADVMAARQ